ncbi:hypothetical protein ABEB36_006761 [Hypothenemus hampei]|uniref:Uncharacterized protein n=1 Tax=Hypothenemus hampei TaxID=57062 RepID=A0ABD1ERN8_HYPHA
MYSYRIVRWAVKDGKFFLNRYPNISSMVMKTRIIMALETEEMELVISTVVLRRNEIELLFARLPDANIIKCSPDVNIKPNISQPKYYNF